MEFASKGYLLLLLLLIPYLLWYFLYRRKGEPTMRLSDTHAYEYAPMSLRVRLMHLPMLLRCLAYALLVICLARPQSHNAWTTRETEGIDIMMCMDISYSMLSEDVAPNRLEVAKDVAAEFISDRPNDNIGLTIFAGEAFTQCPMTTDHASLLNLMQNVNANLVMSGLIQDGTAIGMGLANSISRLKDAKVKSKVIILLTDGSNNVGDISPMTAAQMAKTFGIRVYTIGLGTNQVTRVPIIINGQKQYTQQQGEIDYKTLKDIAQTTNGNFYRAESRAELSQIYHDIDQLEKTKLSTSTYSKMYDIYQPFAIAALVSLFLSIFLSLTVFRRIP
jgi:Ca-activated chloride channel family protein